MIIVDMGKIWGLELAGGRYMWSSNVDFGIPWCISFRGN